MLLTRHNPMPSLRDFLPRRPASRPLPLVHIRPDLLAAAEAIAAQENLPVATVINDLLSFALTERHEADAALAAWQSLTDREKEVAALVCLRLTNADIAAQLVLSPNTVKTHVRHILAKLGLNSKEELRPTPHIYRLTPGATPANHPPSHQADGVTALGGDAGGVGRLAGGGLAAGAVGVVGGEGASRCPVQFRHSLID